MLGAIASGHDVIISTVHGTARPTRGAPLSREHRREQRHPLRVDAEALDALLNGDWQRLTGGIVDVSASGLGIVCDRDLPTGTDIRVTFAVEPGEKPPLGPHWDSATGKYTQSGRVVYSQPEAEVAGLWRIGAALEPLPPPWRVPQALRWICLMLLVVLVAAALLAGDPVSTFGWVGVTMVALALLVSEARWFLDRRAYADARDRWQRGAA